jgi:hypothetical protein
MHDLDVVVITLSHVITNHGFVKVLHDGGRCAWSQSATVNCTALNASTPVCLPTIRHCLLATTRWPEAHYNRGVGEVCRQVCGLP